MGASKANFRENAMKIMETASTHYSATAKQYDK